MTTTADTVTTRHSSSLLDLEQQFSRNFIGRRWQFPAVPYEYEIRRPSTSDVIAVVPLSSRFDVVDAIVAAGRALSKAPQDRSARVRKLRHLLDAVAERQGEFAALQSLEGGLSIEDSDVTVRGAITEARSLLSCEALAGIPELGGVSGHILSWGLPFTDVLTSVLPALIRGDAVVIKPSLRAPLSAAAFAHVADCAGLEPGLVNIVQGTGGDVGAELVGRRDLTSLHVRAGKRTVAAALRARTEVPRVTTTTGGNVVVVGKAGMRDATAITRAVADLVRLGSAGGPLALPLIVVQRSAEHELVAALIEQLSRIDPAPLPVEALRDRAAVGIRVLVDAGARVVLDGSLIPDDIPHRMGWRMRPTLVRLGAVISAATQSLVANPPLGPILGVATYDDPAELANHWDRSRAAGGVAWLQGVDEGAATALPHGAVVSEPLTGDLATDLRLAPAWFRGRR